MIYQAIGVVAIIIGIGLELFRVGSSFSLGTLIAMVGILAFGYGYISSKQRKP